MLNIDFAPTFIELAGLKPPDNMDGRSLRPILTSFQPIGDTWRTDFVVEHSGEYHDSVKGCTQYNGQNMAVSICSYMPRLYGYNRMVLLLK